MADNGKWAKLWGTSLTDLHTANLSNELYGFWARLMLLTKMEGTNGVLQLPRQNSRVSYSLLHVTDEVDLISKINELFPLSHVTIAERHIIVTFPKWHKYQVDSSAERMQKLRAKRLGRDDFPSSSSSSDPNSSSINKGKGNKNKSNSNKRKKPKLDWPESFQLTEKLRLYSTTRGFEPDLQLEKCKNWHLKNGVQVSDPAAGFRNWILKAVEIRDEKSTTNSGYLEPNCKTCDDVGFIPDKKTGAHNPCPNCRSEK